MSKAKTAGEKAATTAETALENGAAALKTGLEKALKGYDAVLGYNKDTAEAVTKSATVAGKSVESITNSEIYSFSKQSIEELRPWSPPPRPCSVPSRSMKRSSSRPITPSRRSKPMSAS